MKKSILIVEDERHLWESLRDMLTTDSYDMEWVQTGHEAVRRSIDRTFDAILLDVDLVDTNGWKVLDCLCGLHPFLPIVVLAGSIDDGEVASTIGAATWLVKPIDRRIVKRIQRLMTEPNEKRAWRAMGSQALRLPDLEHAFPE
jgi:DNA-binding response OmpR family regulator